MTFNSCAICLDFLQNDKKQIQLPCHCSSSLYHHECIIHMINSGADKNFCPHCLTKYYYVVQNNIIFPFKSDQDYFLYVEENFHWRHQQKCNFVFHLIINVCCNAIFANYILSSFEENGVCFFILFSIKIIFCFCLGWISLDNNHFPYNMAIWFDNSHQTFTIFLILILRSWIIDYSSLFFPAAGVTADILLYIGTKYKHTKRLKDFSISTNTPRRDQN